MGRGVWYSYQATPEKKPEWHELPSKTLPQQDSVSRLELQTTQSLGSGGVGCARGGQGSGQELLTSLS